MPKYEKDKKRDDEAATMLMHGTARKAADEMRQAHEVKGDKLNSIMDEIRSTRGEPKYKR